MPIYDYQCSQCGYRGEEFVSASDTAIRACPECGQSAYVRQVCAPKFKLKGTGWYETDFKDKPAKEKTAEKPTSGTDD